MILCQVAGNLDIQCDCPTNSDVCQQRVGDDVNLYCNRYNITLHPSCQKTCNNLACPSTCLGNRFCDEKMCVPAREIADMLKEYEPNSPRKKWFSSCDPKLFQQFDLQGQPINALTAMYLTYKSMVFAPGNHKAFIIDETCQYGYMAPKDVYSTTGCATPTPNVKECALNTPINPMRMSSMGVAAEQALNECETKNDRCMIVATDRYDYQPRNCQNPPISDHATTMCSQLLVSTTLDKEPDSELAKNWMEYLMQEGPKAFFMPKRCAYTDEIQFTFARLDWRTTDRGICVLVNETIQQVQDEFRAQDDFQSGVLTDVDLKDQAPYYLFSYGRGSCKPLVGKQIRMVKNLDNRPAFDSAGIPDRTLFNLTKEDTGEIISGLSASVGGGWRVKILKAQDQDLLKAIERIDAQYAAEEKACSADDNDYNSYCNGNLGSAHFATFCKNAPKTDWNFQTNSLIPPWDAPGYTSCNCKCLRSYGLPFVEKGVRFDIDEAGWSGWMQRLGLPRDMEVDGCTVFVSPETNDQERIAGTNYDWPDQYMYDGPMFSHAYNTRCLVQEEVTMSDCTMKQLYQNLQQKKHFGAVGEAAFLNLLGSHESSAMSTKILVTSNPTTKYQGCDSIFAIDSWNGELCSKSRDLIKQCEDAANAPESGLENVQCGVMVVNNIIFKIPEEDLDAGRIRVGGHFPMTFTVEGKFKYVSNNDPFVAHVMRRVASSIPDREKVFLLDGGDSVYDSGMPYVDEALLYPRAVENRGREEDGEFFTKLVIHADYLYRINTKTDRVHWWGRTFDIPDSIHTEEIVLKEYIWKPEHFRDSHAGPTMEYAIRSDGNPYGLEEALMNRVVMQVEEKFEKYFGYLARCEGSFCTTTLKISKKFFKINQNACKMPSKFKN